MCICEHVVYMCICKKHIQWLMSPQGNQTWQQWDHQSSQISSAILQVQVRRLHTISRGLGLSLLQSNFFSRHWILDWWIQFPLDVSLLFSLLQGWTAGAPHQMLQSRMRLTLVHWSREGPSTERVSCSFSQTSWSIGRFDASEHIVKMAEDELTER